MLKPSLCDYSEAYNILKRTVAVTKKKKQQLHIITKNIVFKICAVFTNCVSEIINTQVDNAKDIDVATCIFDRIY